MQDTGVNSDFIEKVKSHNDIISVISARVQLKNQGGQFFGCCPFHHEKTPSFAVNQREQYYHCFGCGESGDVISFIRKTENCDFMKAVEILAKQAGIEMPETVYDGKIAALKKQKEQIYAINKEAAVFYNKCLFSEKGAAAFEYLAKRGLSQKTMVQFGLGYSPDFKSLPEYLRSKGFSDKEICDAGVCARKQESGGAPYDFFAERIMFPIINTYGDIVGFSGRTMKTDVDIAKYKNSREDAVFSKSNTVFALNLIKKQKNEGGLKSIIIVEGQMDVLKLCEAGITNAVATLGTAFTAGHAREIKRFSESVVLCLDGDSAGQKAALKAIDVLEKEGLYVKVAALPDKLDPDDFIKKRGSDAFLKIINDAVPAMDYLINNLARGVNFENNHEKAKFAKDAINLLRPRRGNIETEVYLALIQKHCGLSADVLKRELERGRGLTPAAPSAENKRTSAEVTSDALNSNSYIAAAKFVLAALLHKQPYANASEDLTFLDPDLNRLYTLAKKGAIISVLFDEFDVENSPQIKEIIGYNFGLNADANKKYFKDACTTLKITVAQRQMDELTKKFKTEQDSTQRTALLTEIQKLTKEITALKKEKNE